MEITPLTPEGQEQGRADDQVHARNCSALGQVAYDTYYAGQTPVLAWQNLSADTHERWNAVALAVAQACVPQRHLPPARPGPRPTQEEQWQHREAIRDFWLPIIAPAGQVDAEKVLDELSDFSHVLNEVSSVYSSVTGGTLSKPMYYASAVIGVYENHVDDTVNEAVVDVLLDIAEDEDDERLLENLSAQAAAYGCADLQAALAERNRRCQRNPS